jgi:1-acyl-sn-glycerol-3-phosphate acyltransferase
VRPLQSGTAYLAQRTGYPILTIGITGSHDLWSRKRVTMRIGPCIDPARYVAGTARARRTALLVDLRAHLQACCSTRGHRACRAPRTEAHSNTREVQTMALAHIPNAG